MSLLSVPVTSVMTSNVITVNPGQKLVDIKHIFEKRNFHHHIPVTDFNKLVGIVSLGDFLYAINSATLDDNDEPYQKLYVRDIMRWKPVTIPSSYTLKQAAEILADGNIHALIISDDGILKGILSMVDIIRYVLKMESNQ
jgi:acetoin utilization protein AcuB